MKIQKNQIIEVHWVDACVEHLDDMYPEYAEGIKPIERTNVGYCQFSDNEKVVISWGIIHNIFQNKSAIHGAFCIPQCMITSIRILN